MSKHANLKVDEIFVSENAEERKQRVNDIFLQIIKKSHFQKNCLI